MFVKHMFPGGTHPHEGVNGKAVNSGNAIRELPAPARVVIPLSQHIGAPCKPIVQKGDLVLAGQKIGEAGGFVSAPVHSSVSGKVVGIEPVELANGSTVSAVVIENDFQNNWVELHPAEHPETLTAQELQTIVREAGIVGMGGAGFPTHVKLSPKNPDSITDVIVNCAECEPYLTSDYRRMMEEPEKLIAGLKVMLKLFPNAKGTLAVEDNKPDAIALLKKLTKDETDISVAALHTKYPQGSERHLIYAVTGRAINSSMLPADAGCIVDNVDTVVAINQAVREGKPLMHRIVTVTGDAVANPQNFIVRIGTNYNELIEEAGGFVQEPAKIISGGPMMGFGIFDLNVPTTKTSSALLCLTHDDVADSQPSACINCGRCVEVCPGRVVPKLLADYAERHDLERFEACNGLECCECGCCSYVCPAKRPLTQAIKSARKMVLAEKKKKQQEAKK